MRTSKEYRFKDNPKEKEFHDKFIEMFTHDRSASNTLSAIVFGWKNSQQEHLTEREEDVCLNIIQWLGSPVGEGFLDRCGYVRKENN